MRKKENKRDKNQIDGIRQVELGNKDQISRISRKVRSSVRGTASQKPGVPRSIGRKMNAGTRMTSPLSIMNTVALVLFSMAW